jgi:Sulfotransferase family
LVKSLLAQESVNPYLFVVGVPRSGTTLLQRMLDAHPQLSVINEAYWLGRDFRQRPGVIRDGLATKKLVRKLLAISKFRQLRLTEAELLRLLKKAKPVRYERFASLIVDVYANRCGKPLVGDKTPSYVTRMPYLHEMWPRARFVHLIRDPRDVCLSMLDWDRGERNAGRYGTWETDPIVSSALFWRRGVSLGREAGAALGPDLYYELRYEDLVTAPADQLRAICAFLDLPYAEAMVEYSRGRTGKPWRSAKAQWLPPTPGLRDWESEMAQPDLERVEAAVADLLTGLGYASSIEPCSANAVGRVRAVCELFTTQLRARGEEVPDDWPC